MIAWQYVRKAVLIVLGVTFLLLGLAGLALPFLQGVLFIAIGVVLLTSASTRARVWIGSYTCRYPRLHATIERMRSQVRRVVGC